MPTKIEPGEVRHMAALSKLILSEEEERVFAGQFEQILGYMTILQSIDTEKIEPLYNVSVDKPEEREDIPCDRRSREEILANAPETDGEYFIVPKIV